MPALPRCLRIRPRSSGPLPGCPRHGSKGNGYQMRNPATDAINYSLGHAWHNVAPGYQGRIQCQFMNCAENATICQHIGQPNSVSFSYWCEAHGSMWRERLPEFAIAVVSICGTVLPFFGVTAAQRASAIVLAYSVRPDSPSAPWRDLPALRRCSIAASDSVYLRANVPLYLISLAPQNNLTFRLHTDSACTRMASGHTRVIWIWEGPTDDNIHNDFQER